MIRLHKDVYVFGSADLLDSLLKAGLVEVSQLLLISSSNIRACDTTRAGTTAVTM
jgi:hypothetical protein